MPNPIVCQPGSKESLGSLAEGFDLTTERAPQIFCYQYSEVLRFAVTFGIHKGFSWDFYSGHQIKKRKSTGRSDMVLENNLWPPANWRERGLASLSLRHREARAAGRATTGAGVTKGTPGRSPLGASPRVRLTERAQRPGHPRLPTGVRGNPQAACNKGGLVRNQTAS